MHLCYFVPSWPLGHAAPNGIVTAVHHQIPAMKSLGHRVTVVAYDLKKGADPAPADRAFCVFGPLDLAEKLRRKFLRPAVQKLGGPAPVAQEYADRFAALHARDPFDLIEMEETKGIALAVQKRLGIPVAMRLHGPWHAALREEGRTPGPEDQWRIDAETDAFSKVAAITSPARTTLNDMIEKAGREHPAGKVIVNPVPLPAGVSWPLPGPVDELFFLGRIDRRKGADVAIRAVAALAAEGSPVRLTLAGKETGIAMEDGRKLGVADYLAAEVDPAFHDRFTYLGQQAPGEVAALRQRFPITLVPSRYENFPNAVAEAMAAGSAVIGSNSYGIGEMIRDGETGLLVPPGDADALKDAIAALLADPSRVPALGQAGRAWAEATLSPAAVAREFDAFYRQVVAAFQK